MSSTRGGMHNCGSMAIHRFSWLIAACVLAWSVCCAAQTADSVGEPSLRLSTALSQVPTETGEPGPVRDPAAPSFTERARQPVEVLQRSREQREYDLLQALAMARRQQQATADIERRLAEVRAQRYANPVVYALAGLLAAAVAGAVFLWRRTRPQQRGQAVEPALPGGPEPA